MNSSWDFFDRDAISAPKGMAPTDKSPTDQHQIFCDLLAKAEFDPLAQYELGLCYLNGWGTPKSVREAIYQFKMASERGSVKSLETLGDLYHNGLEVRQSDEIAFRYYYSAALKGSPLGLWHVGKRRAKFRHPEDSIRWYERAAERGYIDAYLSLAEVYRDGIGVKASRSMAEQYYEKAYSLIKAGCNVGKPAAFTQLGDLYVNGSGVPKLYELARRCYQKATNLNDPRGTAELGRAYETGMGGRQSAQVAMHYYKRSINLGFHGALYYLASLLNKRGQHSEAFTYWKSAVQLCPDKILRRRALLELAAMCREGRGVRQSDRNALHFLRLAAGLKDPEAFIQLARAYKNGLLGLRKSDDKASMHFHKAYLIYKSSYDADDYSNFGALYEKGQGVEKSPEKAFQLYQEGASKGSPLGIWRLGLCYLNGVGTPRSMPKAKHCLRQALQIGYKPALKYLKWFQIYTRHRTKRERKMLNTDSNIQYLFYKDVRDKAA